jgi:hypothetical protein
MWTPLSAHLDSHYGATECWHAALLAEREPGTWFDTHLLPPDTCRITNPARADSNPAPTYLDQVVLQSWFQGPQQAAAAAEAVAAAVGADEGTSARAAQADAAQL